MHPVLRQATADLSWLLTRGYAEPSAIKIVGDRYLLDVRQRMAVRRAACTDPQQAGRAATAVPPAAASDLLLIDGYNLLTTIEAALGGAVVLRCRDNTFRDIAALHGTWRQVHETCPAAEAIGRALVELGIRRAHWYLDKPVSNSGRLASILRDLAHQNDWLWTVDLVPDPDPLLTAAPDLIATADSAILDGCTQWLNLAALVIERHVPRANVVDLR